MLLLATSLIDGYTYPEDSLMLWLLGACSGPAIPERSDVAEFEKCSSTPECVAGFVCLTTRFEPPKEVGPPGACRHDEAESRARVDSLHELFSGARAAAAAPPADLPESCPDLSDEGNHWVIESSWSEAIEAGDKANSSHYLVGVPSDLNGRVGPSAGMSVTDLGGCQRQVGWLLAKRYLAVTVEDELLFPKVDAVSRTYVPGFVKGRVYLYDQQTGTLVCGGARFEGRAERPETPSPARDLQQSCKASLSGALGQVAPKLQFYL